MIRMLERFQIYVFHVGSLAAGGYLKDFPKSLDTEAPFALRGISLRVARDPATITDYSHVNNLSLRWKDSNNMWTASDILPVPNALRVGAGGFGGIGGCPGIIYPEIVYPAGGSIAIDLQNNDASALDVTVYFWGVKLFPPGGIDAPTYPERCAMLDYRYTFPLSPGKVTVPALGLSETRRNILLKINPDADYVMGAAQAGCNNTFPAFPANFLSYKNVLAILSDHNVKPFMDAGVDINYLWGTQQGTFGQGSGFTGNATPGLMVPEIYTRASDLLYLDMIRQDSAYNGQVGAGNVDIQVVFRGRKVFLK